MNLVAKEFVATRRDGDGVLVLSEFAGAASELADALRVNPYDIEGTADAFYRALTMPEDERRTRMTVLRDRVMQHDVHRWAAAFVARLEAEGSAATTRPSPRAALKAAVDMARAAPWLALLLDFDGTLVPFAPRPELAAPDESLLRLLRRLAARPGTEVHIVSGRMRSTLERWFGALPVGLHAEHGLWSRLLGGDWVGVEVHDARWREPALEILKGFAEQTPGALIEEKSAGYAWHHRGADPEFGAAQARELAVHLSALLSNAPVEILVGDMVVELRPQGVDKGSVAKLVLERAPKDGLMFAAGDDRTDEDLFAALPPSGICVHVGPSDSCALLRVADVAAMRSLLGQLAS
jgi:trehalose 6-phosphate synthase/phosphatase